MHRLNQTEVAKFQIGRFGCFLGTPFCFILEKAEHLIIFNRKLISKSLTEILFNTCKNSIFVK
jgi:hypothetical protein